MVYRLGVFLTFLLLTPNISKPHAVYVSVCNVYETKEGSFFSIRMFKDDIFDALGYVGSSKEIKNDQWAVFLDYVNKNFGVTTTSSMPVVWMYLSQSCAKNYKSILISKF